jgi:excisionase family DNA binding protein
MTTEATPVVVHHKPLLVSVRHACDLLDISRSTMWAMIKAGRVKTVSLGRKRLIVHESLEALVGGNIAEPEISEGISKAAPNTAASVERLK